MTPKRLFEAFLVAFMIFTDAHSQPTQIGSLYHFYESIGSILPDGDKLLMITSGGGLQLLDFSRQESPQFSSSINLGAGNIMKAGEFYIHQSAGHLNCVILNQNNNMEIASTIRLQGRCLSACAEGNLVFAYPYNEIGEREAQEHFGFFCIFTVDENGTLEMQYSQRINEHSMGVWSFMNGRKLYLTRRYYDLQIWNLENPANPRMEAVIESGSQTIFAKEDGSYLASYDYFRGQGQREYLIDVRDTEEVFSQIELPDVFLGARQLDDDRLMIIAGAYGYIYNLSDPRDPVLETQYASPGGGQIIEGDRLWQFDQTTVRLYDFSDPQNVRLTSEYQQQGAVTSVAKQGNHLFLSANAGGIRAVDVTDPENPVEVSSWRGEFTPSNFVTNGDWGIAQKDTASLLFDIDNEMEFTAASYIYGDRDRSRKFVVYGNYLVARTSDQGISIYDCSDLGNPQLISTIRGYFVDMTLANETIYLLTHIETTTIVKYDLSEPAHPRLIGSFDIGSSYQIKVDPPFMHAINGISEFNEGQGYAHYYYYDLYVMGEDSIRHAGGAYFGMIWYLYDDESFSILEAKDSTAFIWNSVEGRLEAIEYRRGSLHRRDIGINAAKSMCIDRNTAYIAQGSSLGIYDFSEYLSTPASGQLIQPSTFYLNSPFPNPFNSSVTMTFLTGSAARPTRLAVYDLSGRLVADLTDRSEIKNQKSEIRKLVWNAGDHPAGVYLVRLVAGGEAFTRKIVLMR